METKRSYNMAYLVSPPFKNVSKTETLAAPGGGGGSSIVKVPGDVPPTRVYFLEPLV